MQAVSSCQDWFFVYNGRTSSGRMNVVPICAFGIHNDATPAVLIPHAGTIAPVDPQAGVVKHLYQLREEEADAAGVYKRWKQEG